MNVYQIITDRIIEGLEAGTVPWRRPWNTTGLCVQNAITKRSYRGINVFMLEMAGHRSPYWLTYDQARNARGQVKSGEKGRPVIYWKTGTYTKENPATGEDESRTGFLLRYYTVFNTEQCDGLDLSKLPMGEETDKGFQPIAACEDMLARMEDIPEIEHVGTLASYNPITDQIKMPPKGKFDTPEDYYATLCHELTHSTGHHERLNRFPSNEPSATFGSASYSKEELVAEMGAAFLSGHCRIEPKIIENSANYIRAWLSRLRGDRRLVIMAAAQAQKAADRLLDIRRETVAELAA